MQEVSAAVLTKYSKEVNEFAHIFIMNVASLNIPIMKTLPSKVIVKIPDHVIMWHTPFFLYLGGKFDGMTLAVCSVFCAKTLKSLPIETHKELIKHKDSEICIIFHYDDTPKLIFKDNKTEVTRELKRLDSKLIRVEL